MKLWELTIEELKSKVFVPNEAEDLFDTFHDTYGKAVFEKENYKKAIDYINEKADKKFVLVDGNIIGVGDTVEYMTLWGSVKNVTILDIENKFSTIGYKPIFKFKVKYPSCVPDFIFEQKNKQRPEYLWINKRYGVAKENPDVSFKEYINDILLYNCPFRRRKDLLELFIKQGKKLPDKVLKELSATPDL